MQAAQTVQRVLRKRAFGRRRFPLPSINDVGPPACHQTAGPTGISSRNSLPALNAMPVVQVPQAERRVLRKRDVADSGRPHAGPTPVRSAPDSRVKGKDFQMLGGEGFVRDLLMEGCPGMRLGNAAP